MLTQQETACRGPAGVVGAVCRGTTTSHSAAAGRLGLQLRRLVSFTCVPVAGLISNYYLVACRLQPKNLMTHHSRRSGSLSGDFGVYLFDAVRARYERHDGT